MKKICLLCVGAAALLGTLGCETSRSTSSMVDVEQNALREVRQETFATGVDTYASISPDGTSFAYERYQEGNYDIWVKPTTSTSDSSGRQITFHEADDRRPSWMGSDAIMFDSWRIDLNKLWKKNARGTGGVTLVSRGNYIDLDADVSANGDVVFVSQVSERVVQRDNKGQLWQSYSTMPTIWVLESDGSLTMLGQGICPTWSPDGQRIAFSSNAQGNYEIVVMDRDGANQTLITSNKADDIEPCWSPDGKRLAFTSNRGSRRSSKEFNIWVIGDGGESPTQMTTQKGYEGGPTWASATTKDPAGRIYFHAYQNRDWNIWSLKAGAGTN